MESSMSSLILNNVSVEFSINNGLRSKIFPSLKYSSNKRKERVAKVEVLKNLNISISAGDRLGIVGPNGAGKTTLLRVLGGLLRPNRGTALLDGSITNLIYSVPFVNPNLNAPDNIRNYCRTNKIDEKKINHVIDDICEFAELGEFFDQPLFTYSSGMNSRFTFGLSTAISTNVLIVDEGIGAGDAAFHKKAQDRLNKFYNDFEILVLASHSMELIRDYCNRACYLNNGQIISIGTPDEIIETYLSDI